MSPAGPPRSRIALLAFGDFAFNLYWQSIMVFLVFYYTDALRLPVAAATLTYAAASIWDGIVSLAAGLFVERRAIHGYGRYLLIGAVPLGVTFVLAYLPPPWGGPIALAVVLGGHLLFRTAYAFVNIAYLGMTARISADSGDRGLLTGLRMLFGTAATVTVALATHPLGAWISGAASGPRIYLYAAAAFAAIGTTILLAVGALVKEAPLPDRRAAAAPILAGLRSLAGNRAFLAVNAAMICMIMGVTVLEKSILYYFKYFVGDEGAGRLALASMGALSAIAVPVWVAIARRLGTRAAWLLAASLAAGGMALFAAIDIRGAVATQGFLIGMQAAIIGLHFSFWAMLPDTIEYGEWSTGVRAEGSVFGVAVLLQRIALGLATGLIGAVFAAAGYIADARLSAQTLSGMRLAIALLPFACFALAVLLMLASPLKRGVHARIVDALARRAPAAP
ncbi:MAG: MFS transporter [Pseudomonadota bacterium]